MKALVFHQIADLDPAIGIGLPAGTPAAYDAATAYTVGEYVTYSGTEYYCIQAGTGKTPSSHPTYWLELDADGIPVKALYALIQVEGKAVRWTDDDMTTPTASVGHILPACDATALNDRPPVNELMYNRGPLGKILLIQTAATAKANITFYTN